MPRTGPSGCGPSRKATRREGDLETALDLLARSGAIDETRAEALDWAATAKGALRPLPEHPIKDMLAELSDYVVARIA